MKNILYSAILISSLMATDDLKKVTITQEINSQIVQDVSANEIKSADVADALQKHIPSINIIRRSGIANDILLRGQKRDNINVIVDGTKVCGACVNRMDPPTSHILANNVKMIKVSEGPFDVENFGTLSGLVDITTIKPSADLHGSVGVNVGSFDYNKWFGQISGGNDMIKLLLSASTEKGGQYEDGNGDNFAKQIIKATTGTKMEGAQYQDRYANMDAFTKSTMMLKAYIDIANNQELRLSYTANRSDDVLYPSSKMDAIYDDSDIYNLEYIYDNISFQVYNSTVDHPMSTKYRKMGAKKEKTHFLSTDMKGAKIKVGFDFMGLDMVAGLDGSIRNWDGYFTSDGKPLLMANGKPTPKSLDDVDTTNRAIFLKAKQSVGNIDLDYGIRYDYTDIKTDAKGEYEPDFRSLSGNVFATITADESLKYFAGVGTSNRVPDARELYLLMMGSHFGTPNLDQSTNYEIDLGVEKIFENFSIKAKTYYSYIKDYIAYNSSNKKLKKDDTMGAFHSFENVDAYIYGAEINGVVLASDDISLEYGLAYKRGEKKDPLTGQKGTNLADMRPLKANIALNYDYDESLSARLEFIGATRWDKIDYENGEQELPGYGVLNMRVGKRYRGFDLTLGVDNLLDKTYAITNTYRDLTLLTTGAKVDDIMLLNESGRYFYANVKYEF